MKTIFSLILLSLIIVSQILYSQQNHKNRVIILTDIEADPDDTQSLVRLLLYSNEIEIKGLIATTSCWLKSEVNPESINKVIRAYGEVQPNLIKHEPDFPSAEELLNLVKEGLPEYGMMGVGEGKDSEGSEWIIKELEKNDEHPLWISVWGGVNTLAQTLYKIENTKSIEVAEKMIAKLRVYTISDQDDSGIWIRNNFPNLFYIVTPGDHYGSATWTGINTIVSGIDNTSISNTWFIQNIQQNHGPLGAVYPDVSWGVEGDTPSFLSLIRNGLNNSEHPEWGGWGGRYELYKPEFEKDRKGSSNSGVPYEPETRKIWTNAIDNYTPYIHNEYGRAVRKDTATFNGYKETLWRWRDDFQNDFAARMDWCIKSYQEANHAPVPVLSHPEQITVKSGEGFRLNAYDSYDPDGDNLSYLWYYYPEASSYKKEIKLGPPENSQRIHGTAPKVEKEETIHIILKVTDKGEPQLSRYKRVIVNILPE
ncbi:nucleoside hydrolase-like domain-containing protein [Bacteroidota bacterium]